MARVQSQDYVSTPTSVPGVRVADWVVEAAHVAASEVFEYGDGRDAGQDEQLTYVATGKVLWGQAKEVDRVAVVEAFASNTVVTRVEMVNALVGDGLAQAWGRVLCANETITALNLESNSIGSAGVEALAAGLRGNRTLQELKLANQSGNFTQAAEEALAEAVEGTELLIRLTIDLRSTRARDKIHKCLNWNQEQLRLSRIPASVLEAQAAAQRVEAERKAALEAEREAEEQKAATRLAEEKAAVERQAEEQRAALKAAADQRAAEAAERLAKQRAEAEKAEAEEQAALKAAAAQRRATTMKLEAAAPPSQSPRSAVARSQSVPPAEAAPPEERKNGNGATPPGATEVQGSEASAAGRGGGTGTSDATRATLVWARAGHGGWQEARLVGYGPSGAAILESVEGQERFTIDADGLLMQNELPDGGVEDMTTLEHLHEPGLLRNLRHRFELGRIYTYTGAICIALNPFDWAASDHLYVQSLMLQYRSKALGALPPHVYAVAEEAYARMRGERRVPGAPPAGRNQSILVSGESGSGKTESVKIMMSYLASVSKGGEQNRVAEQVLASNPLLEAFGNACTLRNQNSSRFGKFIEITFNAAAQMCGAVIYVYLLEKTRVTLQAVRAGWGGMRCAVQ